VKPQGQQNFMRGRVNHMTNEEAQQAPDVVLGMFLASSHPATISFDSGASHSFISSSFVAKHSMPIATMKHTMLVSSPGGEMRTKHICPAVSISIRGVDFPSVTPTFYKNKKFCANRSAYKNAYQIVVHMKNFPKINVV
jgi:hypothetical protein